MTFEIIHETFNVCHGEPTSEILEVEAENADAYMEKRINKKAEVERIPGDDGTITYNVMLNGAKERFVITEV